MAAKLSKSFHSVCVSQPPHAPPLRRLYRQGLFAVPCAGGVFGGAQLRRALRVRSGGSYTEYDAFASLQFKLRELVRAAAALDITEVYGQLRRGALLLVRLAAAAARVAAPLPRIGEAWTHYVGGVERVVFVEALELHCALLLLYAAAMEVTGGSAMVGYKSAEHAAQLCYPELSAFGDPTLRAHVYYMAQCMRRLAPVLNICYLVEHSVENIVNSRCIRSERLRSEVAGHRAAHRDVHDAMVSYHGMMKELQANMRRARGALALMYGDGGVRAALEMVTGLVNGVVTPPESYSGLPDAFLWLRELHEQSLASLFAAPAGEPAAAGVGAVRCIQLVALQPQVMVLPCAHQRLFALWDGRGRAAVELYAAPVFEHNKDVAVDAPRGGVTVFVER